MYLIDFVVARILLNPGWIIPATAWPGGANDAVVQRALMLLLAAAADGQFACHAVDTESGFPGRLQTSVYTRHYSPEPDP